MKEKFEELKAKYPNLSSAMCFVKLAKALGRKWTKRQLNSYFNKLVDRDDYLGSEKKEILNWLYEELKNP